MEPTRPIARYFLRGGVDWNVSWAGTWLEHGAAHSFNFSFARQSEIAPASSAPWLHGIVAGPMTPAAGAESFVDQQATQSNSAAVSFTSLPTGTMRVRAPTDRSSDNVANAAETVDLPRATYWKGSFVFALHHGKPRTCPDQCVIVLRDAVDDGAVPAIGRGKNAIGSYSLSGTYDAAEGVLHLERVYDPRDAPPHRSPMRPKVKLGDSVRSRATTATAIAVVGVAALPLPMTTAADAVIGDEGTGGGRRTSGRAVKRSRVYEVSDADDRDDARGSAAGRTGRMSDAGAAASASGDHPSGYHVDDGDEEGSNGDEPRAGTQKQHQARRPRGVDGATTIAPMDGRRRRGGGAESSVVPRHHPAHLARGGSRVDATATTSAANSIAGGSEGGDDDYGSEMGARGVQGAHISGGGAVIGASDASGPLRSVRRGVSSSPVWYAAHTLPSDAGEAAGEIYEGELVGGRPHGFGTAIYRNGLMYEGSWSRGREHGWGIVSDVDDTVVYAGEVADGVPHGRGTFWFSSGDRFSGDWRAGLPHGRGRYDAAGPQGVVASYDGEWKDGLRHGHGAHALGPSRDPVMSYVGTWRDGARHGRGALAVSSAAGDGSAKLVLRASFTSGVADGSRTEIEYADGSRYEGSVRDGVRHGRGTYTFAGGNAKLSGRWAQDGIDEAGTFTMRIVLKQQRFHVAFRTRRRHLLRCTARPRRCVACYGRPHSRV